jgi:hypothetical protein
VAKKAAAVANLSINSVALESYLDSVSMKVTQETANVSGLVTTGPARVVGNYDHSLDISGQFDGASGAVDATLFGLVGNAGVASAFDPTGASAATNDPNYDSTMVLESYQIDAKVGSALMFSATLQGAGALTRATS